MAGVKESGGRVVVLGGGVVGAAVAYYLTQKGHRNVTVVERCAVACAASGKAGGFLGGSWGDGSPTQELHRKGFAAHAELAATLGLASYRRLSVLSATPSSPHRGSRAGAAQAAALGCPWLDGGLSDVRLLDSNAAQVTPRELTEKLVEAAVAAGAALLTARAEGVTLGSDGRVCGVRLAGVEEALEAEEVVVAMGPWAVEAERWFPALSVPMEGIWSSSLVRGAEGLAPFAVFTAEDERHGTHLELYPRPGAEGLYVCGLGGSRHLSPAEICDTPPEAVVADNARVAAAEAALLSISPSLAEHGATRLAQACMRPCSADGLPLVGRLHRCGPENVTVATGTNCWGILWGPAIGKAVAELILEGSSSIDLSPFNPERFSTSGTKGGKRGRHMGETSVGEQW